MKKIIRLYLAIVLVSSCATKINTNNESSEIPVQVDGLHFVTKLKSDWAISAVSSANCMMNLKSFRDEVSKIEKFDYSNDSGAQVLFNYDKLPPSEIKLYKFLNPWSAATSFNEGQSININSRRTQRPLISMVNTLIHERGHFAGYSHNGNYQSGNENSVNYKMGSVSEKHFSECAKE